VGGFLAEKLRCLRNSARWDQGYHWSLIGSRIYAHSIGANLPKSTTLDNLERTSRTLFQNARVFRSCHENLNEDRPTLLAAKMLSVDSSFWQSVATDRFGWRAFSVTGPQLWSQLPVTTWSLVVMSILRAVYTHPAWESPWTAHFHWTNMSTTWWRLVTFTYRLFAMSGNPLPAMLQMPWLALSLALVWTTVTLCFTACHEKKTLISFSASRTVQHGLSVALVDGSKVHGSYTSQPTLAASSSKNRLQVGDIELQVTDDGSTWLYGCRTSLLSTTALSTFIITGTVNCTSL